MQAAWTFRRCANGDPVQRQGRRRPAQSTQERPPELARRRPAGDVQGLSARARPGARRGQHVARQGPLPDRRGALRRPLCGEPHPAAAQKTRPVHPAADAKAQARFKKGSRRWIAEIARDHPEAERLEIWFQDEARVGQTGRVCRRWFERGMRPRGVRDLRHQAVYLFGAVCPERDAGVALPHVGAAGTQAVLDELSAAVAPGARAVVLMDRAPAGTSRGRCVPDNLTPLFLPPYSSELNAIERVCSTCASASSRTACGRATQTSSTPAAPSGTRCSTRAASAPSVPSTGPRRSGLSGVGIRRANGVGRRRRDHRPHACDLRRVRGLPLPPRRCRTTPPGCRR
ncbi:MAG: family transposase [Geminicoccaceae bacterium]|nr:family transposase [Geminicoccaceae bacterium]